MGQQEFLCIAANVIPDTDGWGGGRMRTLVMMHSPAMARQLALELENLGEEWQVHWACDMPSG